MPDLTDTVSRMVAYVDGIHNEARQRYGREYIKYMMNTTTEPDDPPDLTYGEAQTVRLVLREIAADSVFTKFLERTAK